MILLFLRSALFWHFHPLWLCPQNTVWIYSHLSHFKLMHQIKIHEALPLPTVSQYCTSFFPCSQFLSVSSLLTSSVSFILALSVLLNFRNTFLTYTIALKGTEEYTTKHKLFLLSLGKCCRESWRLNRNF